jgi:pimeloyl-ACP methyl ester carboxylesterase
VDQEASVKHVRLPAGPNLAYVSVGPTSATPVLLLHAWAESGRSFDRLLRLLPDTVHAITFDQRGHGRAWVPQTGYAVADFAHDVVTFMDAMGLSSAVLLGSSSGGYIAQHVAITNPHRVAGLVLVGTPRTLQGRPPFAHEVDQLEDPMDAAWVRTSLTWFPRFHEVPEWFIEDRVQDGVRIPAHVWRETFDGLCEARPPTEAGTISARTLIVWGDKDELLSRRQQEDLARAIPRSRLIVYENTGHLVLWEQPERLARDLTAFLENLPQRTS